MAEKTVREMAAFKKDLCITLNQHSMENGSDTPDYVLAEYLVGCLIAFNVATKDRTEWYHESHKCSTIGPKPEEDRLDVIGVEVSGCESRRLTPEETAELNRDDGK